MQTKIKDLALFAILGALTFGLKFAMASLPNIEPVTLLIMIYAYTFKWKALYPVSIYIILEMLVYGFGIWSIGYCYIWYILVIISILLLPRIHHLSLVGLIVMCFGFLFGALYIPIYVITSGWETAITWWIAGISYDALHGVGNLFMVLLLYKPLSNLFKKLYERY